MDYKLPADSERELKEKVMKPLNLNMDYCQISAL